MFLLSFFIIALFYLIFIFNFFPAGIFQESTDDVLVDITIRRLVPRRLDVHVPMLEAVVINHSQCSVLFCHQSGIAAHQVCSTTHTYAITLESSLASQLESLNHGLFH